MEKKVERARDPAQAKRYSALRSHVHRAHVHTYTQELTTLRNYAPPALPRVGGGFHGATVRPCLEFSWSFPPSFARPSSTFKKSRWTRALQRIVKDLLDPFAFLQAGRQSWGSRFLHGRHPPTAQIFFLISEIIRQQIDRSIQDVSGRASLRVKMSRTGKSASLTISEIFTDF